MNQINSRISWEMSPNEEWCIYIYVIIYLYVTQDRKTSHKGPFFLIKIYTAPESWISFPLMYGLLGSGNIWPRYNYLNIWNLRVQK